MPDIVWMKPRRNLVFSLLSISSNNSRSSGFITSTLDAQWENLQDLIKEGNDMVGEDSASEAMLMEWQEKVKSTKASVVCLENNIQKKVKELKLWDWVAAQKLSKLKKDKWITLQLQPLCS
ncbi:hypothetical protein BS47DRAFT_1401349 [Hydnum rufescens UP504]|uniref:Uncharacterized protein n=1 Tax=Hydnum rufescens UP504 TaxID=1448309 RepID=A0A9P6DH36_9AGAM|nr:hypothetical protein BS47DRAFT_1401349 [Hydnum rufescens UP504]